MISKRVCGCCKELLPQSEMIKITRCNRTNKLFLQPSTKIQGRSLYICFKKSCVITCLSKGKLQKTLSKKINSEITEILQRITK